jgi:hypothetical protein
MFLDSNSFEVIVREKDGYINVSQMAKKYSDKKLFKEKSQSIRNKQFKEQLAELKKICMLF